MNKPDSIAAAEPPLDCRVRPQRWQAHARHLITGGPSGPSD